MTLREERFFTYDIDRFPFRDILFQIFGVSDLETIHQTVEGCTEQGYVKFENDQGTYFHKTFYNSPLFHEFLKIYESWIQQVIGNANMLKNPPRKINKQSKHQYSRKKEKKR